MPSPNKKTKVLFVITKSNWGGAQRYVCDLATGLPRDQFEVAVALGGSGALIQKLHAEHIRVLPIFSLARDISTTNDVFSFFELLSIFHREKPSVVHLNSAKASGLSALAARLTGVPLIIFTAHGWAFNEERPLWQRITIKFFSWLTVVLAHKTIAVSEAVHKDTQNWLFVQKKVVTLHNGINAPEFLSRDEARARLVEKSGIPLTPDAILAGTVAELHKNKGLPYAIGAIAILAQKNPSLFYFILGAGEEQKKLAGLIKQHDLQGRVFLLGFVENAVNYLKAFDIFVLPSTKEGLPYVLLEAGLAGLPVVASRVGGIPEIIEDGKTGLLVPSRDKDALCAALQRIIGSPDLRDSFGSALKERIVNDFSLETMISQTKMLYTIPK